MTRTIPRGALAYGMILVRALLVWLCLGVSARACDLALILAVDVSGSVSYDEYQIQRGGLAQALRDPLIGEALVLANARLLVLQWTGSSRQRITLPWTTINTFEDVEAFADAVDNDPRVWRNFSTAIGEALDVAIDAFQDVPDCRRKIVDVSGDGISNEGIPPASRRSALRAAGVTVNGLVIEGTEADLTAYYWENVITGPGAFVVTANTHNEYPERIRDKLLREVVRQMSQVERP